MEGPFTGCAVPNYTQEGRIQDFREGEGGAVRVTVKYQHVLFSRTHA